MEMKELFGGYMSAVIPDGAVDVSDIRQVPDNQEVFTHPKTDQSLIVEILESLEGTDEQAIRAHFEDLASSNDAQGPENSAILLTEEMPSNSISMEHSHTAYYVSAQQKVAKFNEAVRNTINIHIGLFRLPEFSTDIVVSFNDPVNIDPDSSSHGPIPVSAQPWTLEQFKTCLQTIRVNNTDLFGSDS